ncbi:DUF4192 domain-containing protein [Demetria terragena]|uniref:DUF4192 domain-containing protein n=1 Tax=Demetria terragena TaxID=63959 RepID=UPI00036C5625|nr:DUF4192 domain-containing protein [Demetria terragena]
MTSTPAQTRHHTLHGLGELVAITPDLLGFHPSDSLILVGCGPAGLFLSSYGDGGLDPGSWTDVSAMLAEQIGRADPDWCELIRFGTAGAGRSLAREVTARLREQGVPLRHLVLVSPDEGDSPARWSVASCRCGSTCPQGWSEVPDRTLIPALADRVFEGRAPARDREQLVASLRPRTDVVEAVGAAQHPPLNPDRYARALGHVLDLREDAAAVTDLPVWVLREMLEGIQDRQVRDHLLGWLVPDHLGDLGLCPELDAALREHGHQPGFAISDPGAVVDAQDRLRALVTCAPTELVAAPACVLAYWCWQHGGGALATIALERALDADPDYALARLLMQLIQHGIRPSDGTGHPVLTP